MLSVRENVNEKVLKGGGLRSLSLHLILCRGEHTGLVCTVVLLTLFGSVDELLPCAELTLCGLVIFMTEKLSR